MKKRTSTFSSAILAGVILTNCTYHAYFEDNIVPDATSIETTCTETSEVEVDHPDIIEVHEISPDVRCIDLSSFEVQEIDESVRDPYLEFAIDLYARQALEAEGNMMISPASILFAFSMVSAGAAGDTLDQMTEVMLPGQTPEALQSFASVYNSELNNVSGIELHSANSIWINDSLDIGVYQDYLDHVTRYYNAQVCSFISGSDAAAEINGWVNSQTNGMIPHIVDGLRDDTASVLINAIVFDAEWAGGPLEITTDTRFRNADGSFPWADMINGDADASFFAVDARGFILKYTGGQYAFMAILPENDDIDANEFASSMTAEQYAGYWDLMDDSLDVEVRIPEFTCDYSASLPGTLTQMGMNDVFSPELSDLSNMSDKPLFISDVVHCTHIEVDSTGTTASAATSEMALACNDAEYCEHIYLTRPFVYAIVDVETGTPLFIGTVNNI